MVPHALTHQGVNTACLTSLTTFSTVINKSYDNNNTSVENNNNGNRNATFIPENSRNGVSR